MRLPVLDRRRDEEPPVAPEAIDPRIRARRDELHAARRTRRLRRWLYLSVCVTVVAVLYGATRSSVFDVDAILVTGQQHTAEDEVRAATGVVIGDALLEVDLEGAVRRVEALPWVERAEIGRTWSGNVEVAVVERQARAAVDAGPEGWFLVDGHRRVLASQRDRPANLMVISGLPAVAPGRMMGAELVDALVVDQALSPGLRSRVGGIHLAEGEVQLRLRPVGVARIGNIDRLGEKLNHVRTLLAQVDLADLCVIDVRAAGSPVLTRGNPCA